MQTEWRSFQGGAWETEVNVRDFIQKNYHPYDGDDSFLEGPTQDTTDLWDQVLELSRQEREAGGVLDMDTKIISTITSHGPGYLDKEKEKIVGFQTDKPFKRALQPYGGIRMAIKACEDNGYKVDPEVVEYFTTHRKTHNAGVFDAYTPEMRACRSAHIITGLPDAYGRGRIIGDYRRPALYGVDRLIEDKKEQLNNTRTIMYSDVIREREELSEQIRALEMLKKLAEIYGCDISKPANNVLEATQAVYFAYLAAVKEQNGAAMSLGRTSTFLDIYAERDLAEGTFTEKEIQEIIDQFVMKLRLVKFARTPEYNTIFAGDPTWVTESIGGIGVDGRHMVTKMSYRYLNTLNNIGAAPEPNMTVLWSVKLPENFKKFCAETSIKHSAIQYENDDIMRVAAKWVSPPYNADGWRLDVAADLGHSPEMNHKFWRDFRKSVKTANPDAIILAEHYGDPKEWLQKGDQWDTVMNYDAFMEPLTWFLTGMEKHSDEAKPQLKGSVKDFEDSMRHYMASFQTSQLLCAMNELSNHDHSRFMTRTNEKVGRAATLGTAAAEEGIKPAVFREAVVVQMTWPGAPTIYYGDEAGLCGFTDPDNRRTYPWGKEDIVLIDFHRDIIRIHKEHEALRTGSLMFLKGDDNLRRDDNLRGDDNLLCYARFNRREQFVVLVNNKEQERDVELEVWQCGIPKKTVLERVIISNETGYSLMPKQYEVADGVLKISLQKYSAVILMYDRSEN